MQIFITKNVLAPIEQIMNVFNDIKATQDYSKRLPKSNSVEMNQLSDEINGLLTHIEDENIQEKERQRHLRELAECDPLTGINNKKAIEQKMLAMVQSATDKKVRISVGFLDIDDFKDYNTNYGHQEGDNVIKFVANTLKENFKGEVGRNGGDEFVFGYEGDISKEELDRKVKKVYDILNKGYTRGDLLKNMSSALAVVANIPPNSHVGTNVNTIRTAINAAISLFLFFFITYLLIILRLSRCIRQAHLNERFSKYLIFVYKNQLYFGHFLYFQRNI